MTLSRRCIGLNRRTLCVLVAFVVAGGIVPVSAWAQSEDELRTRRPPRERAIGGDRARGDRPHRGREFPPPESLWNRMTEPEREQMESFVQVHFPDMYLELERVKEKSAQRFSRRMGRIASEMRETMEVMETEPKRAAEMIKCRKLDMKLRRDAAKYRRAEGEETRKTLRAKFRELCAEWLGCRQGRRANEIRELEARLKEFKERTEEAGVTREELIDQMVMERLDSPKRKRPKRMRPRVVSPRRKD